MSYQFAAIDPTHDDRLRLAVILPRAEGPASGPTAVRQGTGSWPSRHWACTTPLSPWTIEPSTSKLPQQHELRGPAVSYTRSNTITKLLELLNRL